MIETILIAVMGCGLYFHDLKRRFKNAEQYQPPSKPFIENWICDHFQSLWPILPSEYLDERHNILNGRLTVVALRTWKDSQYIIRNSTTVSKTRAFVRNGENKQVFQDSVLPYSTRKNIKKSIKSQQKHERKRRENSIFPPAELRITAFH